MVHVTMWLAAFFCSVYISILFYFFLMPITHWVTWTDVYPVETTIKVGTNPIMFVSEIQQHKITNYKFIDTLFCKKDGEDKFLRYSQQTQENYAEGPSDKLHYLFPFNKPVMEPSVCFLNSALIITSPMGNIKSKKIDGKNRGHFIKVIK